MSLTINIAKMIDNAIMKCGIQTPQENPELILRAKESIYFVLLEMANSGVPVFMIVPKIIGFQPNKWIYDLDKKVYDIFNLNWRQMNHATVTASGGTNPDNLIDYEWDTYATTSDSFSLSTSSAQSIDYYGLVSYGTQAISFNIKTANVMTSDGQWHPTEAPFAGEWRQFIYGNNVFIGISLDSTNAIISTDLGSTWNEVDIGARLDWNCGIYTNKFILLCINSDTYATSTNGTTWALSTLPASLYYTSIASDGDGTIIAVANGTDIAIRSTDNGVTFTQITMPVSTHWNNIIFANNRFIAYSINSSISAYTLDDGDTWVIVNMPTSAYWTSSTYFNNKLYVCASNSTNTIAVSDDDGQSYELLDLPLTGNWSSIATGNNLLIMTQSNSNVSLSSSDGISWDILSLPAVVGWYTINFGGGSFITGATGGTLAAITQNTYIQWATVSEYTDYTLNDAEWLWVDLETPQNANQVKLTLTSDSTLSLRAFFTGNRLSSYSQPCAKMNRDNFFSLPTLGVNGTPINYFLLRDKIPQLQIWQSANNTPLFIWSMVLYIFEIPDIEYSLPLTLPVPDWYLEGIIWNLAAKIMYYIPNVPDTRMQMIQLQADKQMSLMANSNSDTSYIDLVGNSIAAYTRRC